MSNDAAERLPALLRGRKVAVAESLTGGLLSDRLALLTGSGEWFRGGLVAYSADVKREVLGIGDAPVVSAECALAMALGVGELLGATATVAVTGVGGPGAQDGVPEGTVCFGVSVDGRATATCERFEGEPKDICEQTCDRAISLLVERLSST